MKKFSLKNHIGILFSVIDENGVLTEIKGSERRVSNIKINGKTSPVLIPAEIKQSRTMVPLRFVSDIFNTQTNWESDTKTVVISAE